MTSWNAWFACSHSRASARSSAFVPRCSVIPLRKIAIRSRRFRPRESPYSAAAERPRCLRLHSFQLQEPVVGREGEEVLELGVERDLPEQRPSLRDDRVVGQLADDLVDRALDRLTRDASMAEPLPGL